MPDRERHPSIAEWLSAQGLAKYIEVFAENDIDLEVLPELTEADLEQLGVTLGHRRKLLKAINAGAPAPSAETIASTPKEHAEAERRQLTVMFCDLVGSTALSGRLDPEDYREVIRSFQETCARTVREHGGYVAKHLGDGLLAYFGYPQAQEDDAERAVRAGLAATAEVATLTAPEPLRARVGIETGLVVVGELVGEGISEAGAISGETPNLAARLEQLAAPGEVVVGPTARRILGGAFDVEDMGAREIKGIAAPVRAARITGERQVQSRFEARRVGALTALVGREVELDTLLRRWQEAKSGEGQVVLISGEPGIGKSRLTHELRQRIAAESHTRLRYQCSPHHTNSALYPVIGQLTFAAGIEAGEPAAAKLDKLEALFGAPSDDMARVMVLLADLLSIPIEGRYPALDYTPQRRKEETLKAWADQLAALAADRPVLVIHEDVHWVDPTTYELLDLAVERVIDLPVLMLVTFRPEYTAPWLGQAHVTPLGLSRLSRRLSAAMATTVAAAALPGAVVADIVAKTEGVPLFVEELTKTVIESGPCAPDATTVAAVHVPATLSDSLTARLDRLGPAKEVAQIGAVLGRTFSYDLLAAVAGVPESDLRAALDRLVAAELVLARGAGAETSYTFKHALIQDAAYDSLLRTRRAELHRAAAGALKASALADTQPEIIAHHYTQAGLAAAAISFWRQAAEHAAARSANEEAVNHARVGLGLLGEIDDENERMSRELALRTILGNAEIGWHGFNSPDAAHALERALELSRMLGDDRRAAGALIGLTGHYQVRRLHEKSAAWSRQCLALAEQSDDRHIKIAAYFLMGLDPHYTGEFATAAKWCEKALEVHQLEGPALPIEFSEEPGLCSRANFSVVQWTLGYPDRARRTAAEAIAGARALGHDWTTVYAMDFASFVHGECADDHEYAQLAHEGLALAIDRGVALFVGLMGLHDHCAKARAGADLDEMYAALVTQEDAFGPILVPWFRVMIARVHADRREYEQGLAACKAALAVMETTGARQFEADALQVKGRLLSAQSEQNGRAAEDCFARALEVARGQSAKSYELRAATGLASLWRDQGRAAEGRDLLAPIYGWFSEGFDTADLIEAKALLDELN